MSSAAAAAAANAAVSFLRLRRRRRRRDPALLSFFARVIGQDSGGGDWCNTRGIHSFLLAGMKMGRGHFCKFEDKMLPLETNQEMVLILASKWVKK